MSRSSLLRACLMCVALATLVATQCQCGNIDFVTRHGMVVFVDDGVLLAQHTVEDVTDQFLYLAKRATYGTRDWTDDELVAALDGTTIVVRGSWLDCWIGPGRCAGLYYETQKRIVLGMPEDVTFCDSAYWHELIHLTTCEIDEDCPTGTKGHSDPLFTVFSTYKCLEVGESFPTEGWGE